MLGYKQTKHVKGIQGFGEPRPTHPFRRWLLTVIPKNIDKSMLDTDM